MYCVHTMAYKYCTAGNKYLLVNHVLMF